jgi:hypothetical protein
MASGKLGSAALAASTDTTIYTVPASKVATVNVSMVNRGATAVRVRIAIGSNPPANADYIEYDAEIPANGILERSGLVMSASELLIARASTANVTIRAYGFEEAA